jgi:predicted urease superfamily metal-dependent hydrolase
MKASQERMEVWMDASIEMIEACLEKTEVNQGKIENKVEAYLKDMKMEIIRAWMDRYGDQILVVRHHRQPKKQAQSESGSWRKLTTARG